MRVAFNFRTYAKVRTVAVVTKRTLPQSSTVVSIASGTSAYNTDVALASGTFESNIIAYTGGKIGVQSAAQLCFKQEGEMPSGTQIQLTFDDGEQIKRRNAFKCVTNVEDVIAAQAVGALQSKSSEDEKKDGADGGADAKDKKRN